MNLPLHEDLLHREQQGGGRGGRRRLVPQPRGPRRQPGLSPPAMWWAAVAMGCNSLASVTGGRTPPPLFARSLGLAAQLRPLPQRCKAC